MRLVQYTEGALEIRWTWLPYWIAVNPKLVQGVEVALRDAVLVNGLTTSPEDLDRMHSFVVRRLCALFPGFVGLETYLESVSSVQEPTGP
jgi:hypothetical protein